jgi:hypothetical protein
MIFNATKLLALLKGGFMLLYTKFLVF